MYTNLRQLMLILGIVLVASLYLGAFSSTSTTITYAQTRTTADVSANAITAAFFDSSPAATTIGISSNVIFQIASSQSHMYPSVPSDADEKVIPQTQPLGTLVAISWNNLERPFYQSIISQFFILPSNDELWYQNLTGSDDPRNISSEPAINYVSPQETYLEDALFRNYKAQGERSSTCSACHDLKPTIDPTTTSFNYEKSVRLQDHAEPIVECEACHLDIHEDVFGLSSVDE